MPKPDPVTLTLDQVTDPDGTPVPYHYRDAEGRMVLVLTGECGAAVLAPDGVSFVFGKGLNDGMRTLLKGFESAFHTTAELFGIRKGAESSQALVGPDRSKLH